MERRLKLQQVLKQIIKDDGEVHFQPPENIRLSYPCIIYSRDSAWTARANNELYSKYKRYKITVIDADPDSDIPDRLAALPMCSFAAHFTADGLNHDVYNLYF